MIALEADCGGSTVAEIFYDAFEVDQKTFDALDIGDEYEGGVVVDGISDQDRNTLILVVRYGTYNEEENDG